MHNTKMKVATRNNLLRKLSNSKMGSKRRYYKNNSIGIMLFCGWVRSTSLGEIISCPETEPRAKQCMQSRHRMPETNQCRTPVLSGWNYATRHPERCMCLSGNQWGNQWGSLSIWSEPGREKARVEELFLA